LRTGISIIDKQSLAIATSFPTNGN